MYSLRKQMATNAGKPPHARLRGPEKKSFVANRRCVDDAMTWENASREVTQSSAACCKVTLSNLKPMVPEAT